MKRNVAGSVGKSDLSAFFFCVKNSTFCFGVHSNARYITVVSEIFLKKNK